MAIIKANYFTGGAGHTPRGVDSQPPLATVLRDIADDLGGVKTVTIATPDAGAAYTANEQALLNEIKVALNTIAAVTLKTVKG